MKHENYINGKCLLDGFRTTIENDKGVCLVLLDDQGTILAYTAQLNPSPEKHGIRFEEEKHKPGGGGKIIINTVAASATKPWKSNATKAGKIAKYFGIAAWSDKELVPGTSEIAGSPELYYPPEKEPEMELIVGELTNNPLITEDTNFQFNESNITFVIGK